MTDTPDSDILLMLKDPAQRDKGFLKLMDLYKEPVYWHIRRLVLSHEDAQDILQETFIKVYRHANSFRGDCKFYTWLYRIATNECSRHFRINKKKMNASSSMIEDMANKVSGNGIENSNSILFKFQQAVLQLPEKQKIVFNLRYYDELSYKDISQILNTTVNTLKTNYHYASEKIKKHLIENA